jgi:uncharacterized protein
MINARYTRILIVAIGFFCIPASLFAYTSPGKATGFMNDFAGILTVEQEKDIEMRLAVLNMTSGTEVAMVTVPTLGNETIETFATKLFEEWGIGGAQEDDGLLVLIAPNDRQVRIEVGYGLEGAVTDIQSGNIIRTVMTPAFAKGDYYAGMTGAVDALIAIINNSPEAAKYSAENSTKTGNVFSNIDLAPFFFFIIIFLNIFARILGKTKSWWLGGVLGAIAGAIVGLIFGFVSAGIVAMVILTILGLIFDFIVSKHPPGSSGHGGFWPMFFGGGRGGSGGGFGGFGGGMSGGGGASGRW